MDMFQGNAHGSVVEILNGSDILVRCLQVENVKYMWGYPGGVVLYIYDVLYKQDIIEHVLVRYEQVVVHVVDGYVRAIGDVGVVLVIFGPGVINVIIGIVTVYMDSIPMVIIIGQVFMFVIGLDVFQECDIVGITCSIVKYNFLVKDVVELVVILKKVFHIVRIGCSGPVVVDILKDVFLKTMVFHYPESVEMRSYNLVCKGHGGQIRKVVQLLLGVKCSYIYIGGGVILVEVAKELCELCALLNYFSISTLMGLGAILVSDPNFLGMLGMHGTYEVNMTMQNVDVVIAVGVRFDDRVIGNFKHFAQVERKIIHIDIDPSSISKCVKVDISIVGDVKDVLQELIVQIKESLQRFDQGVLMAWWNQVNEWKKCDCLKYKLFDEVIKFQFVIEKLIELMRGTDHYIMFDVGQYQMFVAQFCKFEELRCWINFGGLGTMGVGLFYVMGIKLVKFDVDVFCVIGEGSIQMCIQELLICLQYNTLVKVLSFNNCYLGMVRQWQQLDYGSRYSYSYMDVLFDFVKLAEVYGHVGMLIERSGDVEGALCEVIKLKDRTVFLDIRTDLMENVWLMVQVGKGISEMLLGSEDL